MVRRVGYVFQNPDHQLFNNNCWDEIAYGPRNIQLNEVEVKARVEEAAGVVGRACERSVDLIGRLWGLESPSSISAWLENARAESLPSSLGTA